MNPYDAGYGLIHAIVAMIGALWPLAGPFIIMGAIIGVFSWVNRLSRKRDNE